jgi:hypothetical protein
MSSLQYKQQWFSLAWSNKYWPEINSLTGGREIQMHLRKSGNAEGRMSMTNRIILFRFDQTIRFSHDLRHGICSC